MERKKGRGSAMDPKAAGQLPRVEEKKVGRGDRLATLRTWSRGRFYRIRLLLGRIHRQLKNVRGETQDVKLAAIMFTDMVGYSASAEKNETLALELLEELKRLLRPIFHKYRGQEIKTIGDAFLVEFTSVLEAVRCATEIAKTLANYNASADRNKQLRIRIGIHLGDIIHKNKDVFGVGVNIASRIEPWAEPGGICISQDVYSQIRHRPEFSTRSIGEQVLKNISSPMPLYKVLLGRTTGPRVPTGNGKTPPSSAAPGAVRVGRELAMVSQARSKDRRPVLAGVAVLLMLLLGTGSWDWFSDLKSKSIQPTEVKTISTPKTESVQPSKVVSKRPPKSESIRLAEVKNIYIEEMPNDLDKYLADEMGKEFEERLQPIGKVKKSDAILGLYDTASGAVVLYDKTKTQVLWAGKPPDRRNGLSELKPRGLKKLARGLMNQLARAIKKNQKSSS